MFKRNLLVCSMLLGTVATTGIAYADEAAVIAEREAQQASEVLKQEAQAAEIQAERDRITAENTAREAINLLPNVEQANAVTQQVLQPALAEDADVATIAQVLAEVTDAKELTAEKARAVNEKWFAAQQAADSASQAAQDAQDAADEALTIGLTNWVNMTQQAADEAAADAAKAQAAAEQALTAAEQAQAYAEESEQARLQAKQIFIAATFTGPEDAEGQAVAITDTDTTTAGKLRINLDDALPQGKVTVNVRYSAHEVETAYLTLFGASTSSSKAVADLKMDSGYAAEDGNVGIKLRSTDSWIADYQADHWSNVSVTWDSVETMQFTVAVNGEEIGTYDMNFVDNVETIEVKLGSNAKVTDYTLYADDLYVFADQEGTAPVFIQDFEEILVGTDLSGFDSNYSSSTNSAVVTDTANADGYLSGINEGQKTASQSVAITDPSTETAGKLRVKLDSALATGQISVKVKYDALESETAYLSLFGSSTSTSAAVADLKMDSGYAQADGMVGIKLRGTEEWIADYAADEWATLTVAWDNVISNQITVSIDGELIGTYAMYNNFDVQTFEVKLGSNAKTTDYTLYLDDLAIYADEAGTDLVFADDFEAIEVGTNLSGYGDFYNNNSNFAVVNNVENATVIAEEVNYSQSVAITDTATDNAGKLRLNLEQPLAIGQVSVKVKYNALETETAYLTLFGASTSSSAAVADLKMDSGYAQTPGMVGIKLRGTEEWIADFPADEWVTLNVAWDNAVSNQITVSINGEVIGSYAMYNNYDVETIEVKLGSNAKTTEHTLYLDDLAVYADTAGTDLVFFDNFEGIDVDTDLSGYNDSYDSKSNSAVINNVDNGTTGTDIVIGEEQPVQQWVGITDTSTEAIGRLRLNLDNVMPEGKLSVKVKYSALESETAYITLFGSSTSTSNAVADLKLDSGYAQTDGMVGINLRSTNAWIADIAADEWVTIDLAWDNITTNQITVSAAGQVIGSFAMYNNFDVETIDFKLSSTAKTSPYIFFIDDIEVYSDAAGSALVFSDNFDETPVGTNLSGYGNNYSTSSSSAVVTDQESPIIETPEEEEKVFVDVNPNLVPADNFDLTQWYVSVPTDLDGNGKSDSIYEEKLNAGYENHEYFYSAEDGGMVFRCYIDGYKTSTNTSYTRTELREMLRAGDTSISTKGVNGNNWVFGSAPTYQQELAGGVDGNMKATLAVNHVTTTGDSGQVGRVIIGQIHAAVDEPIRLYYRLLPGHTKGSIYFAHEPSNENPEQWYELIGGKSSSQPEPADGIELGEKFGYEIDVQGNTMTVSITREGKATITQVVDMTDSGYDGFYIDSNGVEQEDYMYFKAGVYNQNKSGLADDFVQATFYSLEQTHN